MWAKMQTSDFKIIFSCLPKVKQQFLGAYALDQIPDDKHFKINHSIIFNLDKADQIGSHWLALVRLSQKDFDLFDSQGVKFENLKPFLKFKNASFNFNSEAFQMSSTNSCGLFASYFIIHRLMNLDLNMQELLSEIFESNKEDNEKKVAKFFRKLKET